MTQVISSDVQYDVTVAGDQITVEVAPGIAVAAGGDVTSVNGRQGAVTGLAEQSALDVEATARAAADTSEASTRAAADTAEATARADGDALLIPLTQKAQANGVATLGSDGLLAPSQLPSIAITDWLGTAASQAAMLALSGGKRGDWCTRTDLSTDWILIADDATQLASWRQRTTPSDAVSSVNGRTGAVTGLAEQSALDIEAAARVAADSALQPLDAELSALAGLTSAADRVPYFTGSGTAALATLTAFVRTLLDDADAATARATLVLGNVDNTSDATKNSATATLTNKRITQRVVAMADATSCTPNADTADTATLSSTQAAGTLTVNNPSGTPTDGQPLTLRLKSTNAQTYAFGTQYRGSTDVGLPATLAAATTDYLGFRWNAGASKWDFVAKNQGF